MRIFMMTDLEGVTGVVNETYIDESSDFYRSARALLTADANAAIAGCFDAGAAEVVVVDGHSEHRNFDTAALDPRVAVDKTPWPWTGAMNADFDATLMIGQHAMAGTIDGFLDHTMCPQRWFEYRINDRPIGEIGMWATMAGHFGVPLVYLAGDLAACAEAADLLPGIVTTAVKRGRGRNHAESLPPEQAHDAIRHDVARCLRARDKWPAPLKWGMPITCRLTTTRSDYADDFAARDGVQRIDARTLETRPANQFDLLV